MPDSRPAAMTEAELQTLREKIERKHGKTVKQLYDEREKRVRDATELRVPDRIPIWPFCNPGRFSDLPQAAAYYEPAAWTRSIIETVVEFEPDLALSAFASSGACWEALDVKNRQWPGGALPPDYGYQFIEGEYMKEDEYDYFLSDPSDFVVRRYLPRLYGALLPLSKLPPLGNLYQGFEGITPLLASPEFVEMAGRLHKAGRELQDYFQATGNVAEILASLGFPAHSEFGGAGGAPFDTLSSFLRGMEGSMVDMFRRPDKLLAACDLILQQRIAAAKPADPARGAPPRIALPLWRGDHAFMSQKQFEKFYWPGLKKALLASIELGYCPMPIFEAYFGERLECLLELPKGKILPVIDHTDVKRTKEILSGHTCIIAESPASIRYGSIQEAEDYYKRVIDESGGGGGLMLSVNVPDKATNEEIKRMLDNLKEYGKY